MLGDGTLVVVVEAVIPASQVAPLSEPPPSRSSSGSSVPDASAGAASAAAAGGFEPSTPVVVTRVVNRGTLGELAGVEICPGAGSAAGAKGPVLSPGDELALKFCCRCSRAGAEGAAGGVPGHAVVAVRRPASFAFSGALLCFATRLGVVICHRRSCAPPALPDTCGPALALNRP